MRGVWEDILKHHGLLSFLPRCSQDCQEGLGLLRTNNNSCCQYKLMYLSRPSTATWYLGGFERDFDTLVVICNFLTDIEYSRYNRTNVHVYRWIWLVNFNPGQGPPDAFCLTNKHLFTLHQSDVCFSFFSRWMYFVVNGSSPLLRFAGMFGWPQQPPVSQGKTLTHLLCSQQLKMIQQS